MNDPPTAAAAQHDPLQQSLGSLHASTAITSSTTINSQQELSLWISNRLNTEWSAEKFASQLQLDSMNQIIGQSQPPTSENMDMSKPTFQVFNQLETNVKLKLLISVLSLKKKQLSDLSPCFSQLFEECCSDLGHHHDPWVKVMSHILRPYPEQCVLNYDLQSLNQITDNSTTTTTTTTNDDDTNKSDNSNAMKKTIDHFNQVLCNITKSDHEQQQQQPHSFIQPLYTKYLQYENNKEDQKSAIRITMPSVEAQNDRWTNNVQSHAHFRLKLSKQAHRDALLQPIVLLSGKDQQQHHGGVMDHHHHPSFAQQQQHHQHLSSVASTSAVSSHGVSSSLSPSSAPLSSPMTSSSMGRSSVVSGPATFAATASALGSPGPHGAHVPPSTKMMTAPLGSDRPPMAREHSHAATTPTSQQQKRPNFNPLNTGGSSHRPPQVSTGSMPHQTPGTPQMNAGRSSQPMTPLSAKSGPSTPMFNRDRPKGPNTPSSALPPNLRIPTVVHETRELKQLDDSELMSFMNPTETKKRGPGRSSLPDPEKERRKKERAEAKEKRAAEKKEKQKKKEEDKKKKADEQEKKKLERKRKKEEKEAEQQEKKRQKKATSSKAPTNRAPSPPLGQSQQQSNVGQQPAAAIISTTSPTSASTPPAFGFSPPMLNPFGIIQNNNSKPTSGTGQPAFSSLPVSSNPQQSFAPFGTQSAFSMFGQFQMPANNNNKATQQPYSFVPQQMSPADQQPMVQTPPRTPSIEEQQAAQLNSVLEHSNRVTEHVRQQVSNFLCGRTDPSTLNESQLVEHVLIHEEVKNQEIHQIYFRMDHKQRSWKKYLKKTPV